MLDHIRLRIFRLLWPSYRLMWPQLDWYDDADFTAYLRRFGELGGMNTHRRYALAQLLRLVRDVPGDTAECGVFRGAASYQIAQLDRPHHAFDSFAGVSAPGPEDGTHWHAGDLAAGLDEVRRNLADCPNIVYHPGWIPERFPEVADRTFAFVHIDVDLAQPTADSMAFFYPRMAPGGIIVVDDYGFSTCPGATAVCDSYLADKPEPMVGLPTGGGFLIRR
jgi:O-methyltransferase